MPRPCSPHRDPPAFFEVNHVDANFLIGLDGGLHACPPAAVAVKEGDAVDRFEFDLFQFPHPEFVSHLLAISFLDQLVDGIGDFCSLARVRGTA